VVDDPDLSRALALRSERGGRTLDRTAAEVETGLGS